MPAELTKQTEVGRWVGESGKGWGSWLGPQLTESGAKGQPAGLTAAGD